MKLVCGSTGLTLMLECGVETAYLIYLSYIFFHFLFLGLSKELLKKSYLTFIEGEKDLNDVTEDRN